ncbi:hypothetical protein ACYCNO_24080 [Klebsiella pneumoniae]
MKINLYGEGMKTVSGVLVYLAVCFLVFTAWLICFAQHAPFPGGEQALTLTYLLNVFFVYFLMVPFIHFFQVETYYKALMGLADGTEHIIQFYEEVPVMLIYLFSAGLTLFFYFIPLKLFFNKKLKLQLQQKQRKDI